MNSKRVGLGLLILFGVCILLFAAVGVEGLKILKSKSNQMVSLKLQNETSQAQLSDLVSSKKDIEKYSYFKSVAASVIPNDKDQAQAVVDLNQMAEDSGILLQDITFPTSNLGHTTTTPANATGASGAAISQATPVTGVPGLYSLKLTITPQTGDSVPPEDVLTYPKIIDFLSRIENDRRTAQITEFDVQTGNDGLTFSLTVNIFIKPSL